MYCKALRDTTFRVSSHSYTVEKRKETDSGLSKKKKKRIQSKEGSIQLYSYSFYFSKGRECLKLFTGIHFKMHRQEQAEEGPLKISDIFNMKLFLSMFFITVTQGTSFLVLHLPHWAVIPHMLIVAYI